MAKKKKESVVEETTEQVIQEPIVEDKTSDDKITVKKKPKMKSLLKEDEVIKVNLSEPPKDEADKQSVDSTETEETQEEVIEDTTDKEEIIEESTEENVEETDTPVLEEITDEEVEEPEKAVEEVAEAITESQETGKPLPENIQKLVDFMEETGGDMNDYVKLNQDYSKLESQDLLFEHYKQTKPHLNTEEINFLMEDQFSYDEDVDDERDIRRKKLALKEQVANAKSQLEENKSKYYEDIKMGSKLTSEQQKAIDFFNRYNKETESINKEQTAAKTVFLDKTEQVFNDKFKGFEYNIGNKKYRFNVKNADEIKTTQSDINNFARKFLDKNNVMKDAKGYHKSLYTAMNADAVANHFYEQGRTDAMKDSIAKGKNISMDPRQSHGEVKTSGVSFKVLGDNSDNLKFKIKQNK